MSEEGPSQPKPDEKVSNGSELDSPSETSLSRSTINIVSKSKLVTGITRLSLSDIAEETSRLERKEPPTTPPPDALVIDITDGSLCERCMRTDFATIMSSTAGPTFEPCGILEVSRIDSNKSTCSLCRMIWDMLDNSWRQMDGQPSYIRDREGEVVSDLRSGYRKPHWDYFTSEVWHQFCVGGRLMSWAEGELNHNTFSVGIDETWDERDMYRDRFFTRSKSRTDINIFPINLRKAKQIDHPEPAFFEATIAGLKTTYEYMRAKKYEWSKPQGLGNINIFGPAAPAGTLCPEDLQYSDEVDLGYITRMLAGCEDHGELCQMPTGSENEILTLMDLEVDQLVQLPMSTRYFTLSYLWGNAEDSMKVDHANGTYDPESLHLTLKDAMLLVKRLGERYLWIDYICINQEDKDAKLADIQRMDLIYSNAYATLVAASGTDSNAGLPGVRPGTRQPAPAVEKFGTPPFLLMRDLPSLRQQLERSIWNTRAWTFQESLLSRRCLVFSHQDVSFQCRFMHHQAESEREPPPDDGLRNPDNSESKLAPDLASSDLWGQGWSFEAYVSLIERYSARHMSFESDAVFALAGIMSRLQKRAAPEFDLRFYWGMPSRDFDKSLIWNGKMNLYAKRRVGIPSWSFLSYPEEISGPGMFASPNILPGLQEFDYFLEDPSTERVLKVGDPFPEPLVDIGLSQDFFPTILRFNTWSIPLTVTDQKDTHHIDAAHEEGNTWQSYVGREFEVVLFSNKCRVMQGVKDMTAQSDKKEWVTVIQVPVMYLEVVDGITYWIGEHVMSWEEWEAGNPRPKTVRIG
ncbi:uncharacterized protein PAC_12519 [Phialocephala subalpina]|uniref:Heterokaryon incompatibility domain-containing protein n=1 Tax=Phialocephala subalpina TaxID=576137 RepID=A0A1L7XC76_9HELO|nr:uncharacterized protein PAC_12519 [Phialocephala subalpina]